MEYSDKRSLNLRFPSKDVKAYALRFRRSLLKRSGSGGVRQPGREVGVSLADQHTAPPTELTPRHFNANRHVFQINQYLSDRQYCSHRIMNDPSETLPNVINEFTISVSIVKCGNRVCQCQCDLRQRHLALFRRDNVAGTYAPSGPALAMPFIEDEWWTAENEGRMVDLSNCLQVCPLINPVINYVSWACLSASRMF